MEGGGGGGESPVAAVGPLTQRLVSRQWKDRVNAYDELTQIFSQGRKADAAKYGPYLKKMVADSYPRAQEAALATVTAFAQGRNDMSSSEVGEVASVIIEKCLAGRPSTKKNACQALLLLMQYCSTETVMNRLLKGCANKLPKISAGCLFTLTLAIKTFGTSAFDVEKFYPILKACFDGKDQEVRTEALSLAVELHRWQGSSLLEQVKQWDLRPAQLKELEGAIEGQSPATRPPVELVPSSQKQPNVNNSNTSSPPPSPRHRHRSLSSTVADSPSSSAPSSPALRGFESTPSTPLHPQPQHHLHAASAPATPFASSFTSSPLSHVSSPSAYSSSFVQQEKTSKDGEIHHSETSVHDVSSTSSSSGINLLSTLTSDWYKEMESEKWQTRKEQIDELINACNIPPYLLKPGDYSKVVQKLHDNLSYNKTVVVASALKAIGVLSRGLRRDFLPYARRLCPLLLDTFKDKKALLVAASHSALTEMHAHSFQLSDLMNEITNTLVNHKVPRVKSECLKWMLKCVLSTQGQTLGSDVAPWTELLLKCTDDTQAKVRDAAYNILAALVEIHGDDFAQTYLVLNEDLDRLKVSKICRMAQQNPQVNSSNNSSSLSHQKRRRAISASTKVGSSSPSSSVTTTPTTNKLKRSLNADSPSTPSPTSTTPSKTENNGSAMVTPQRSSSLGNERSETEEEWGDENSSPSSTFENGLDPSTSTLSEELLSLREELEALRGATTSRMEELEARLEAAQRKKQDEDRFVAELHGWNMELIAQVDTLEREKQQLEMQLSQKEKEEEEEEGEGAGKKERFNFPNTEDLKQMSEEELNEMEKKQEELLLTIRKIKIGYIR
ncbi:hypothetical protein QOT17_008734 [Balamuthia mandrillaris]